MPCSTPKPCDRDRGGAEDERLLAGRAADVRRTARARTASDPHDERREAGP